MMTVAQRVGRALRLACGTITVAVIQPSLVPFGGWLELIPTNTEPFLTEPGEREVASDDELTHLAAKVRDLLGTTGNGVN
jgi:hypothetical protein